MAAEVRFRDRQWRLISRESRVGISAPPFRIRFAALRPAKNLASVGPKPNMRSQSFAGTHPAGGQSYCKQFALATVSAETGVQATVEILLI
jgi:hypothetical protein